MLEVLMLFASFLFYSYLEGSLLLKAIFLLLIFFLCLPGIYGVFYAPFLPSHKQRLSAVLSLYTPKEGDKVVDLGCGSGTALHVFEKAGAKDLTGYEISFYTFCMAWILRFVRRGVYRLKWKNFWYADLSQVDVIYCFLMDRAMIRFEKEIWSKLPKGVKVISNQFRMPTVKPKKKLGSVYLYEK